MNTKLKNGIVWISVTVGIFWVIQLLLSGIISVFSGGSNFERHEMGRHGFEPHHGMMEHYHRRNSFS